jgi:predicted nucleic acid-binding protein
MLIIADSSALVSLATCDALDVVLALYSDIKVPQAVYDEVVEPGKSQAAVLKTYLQNRVEKIDATRFVFTAGGLGQGEIEAMALYKQLSADQLLIDDRRARAIAEHNDIRCIGALGILLVAKHKGVIQQVSPLIEKLRNSSVFYGETLLEKVLQLAGE